MLNLVGSRWLDRHVQDLADEAVTLAAEYLYQPEEGWAPSMLREAEEYLWATGSRKYPSAPWFAKPRVKGDAPPPRACEASRLLVERMDFSFSVAPVLLTQRQLSIRALHTAEDQSVLTDAELLSWDLDVLKYSAPRVAQMTCQVLNHFSQSTSFLIDDRAISNFVLTDSVSAGFDGVRTVTLLPFLVQ
jgi:hypothetical protein